MKIKMYPSDVVNGLDNLVYEKISEYLTDHGCSPEKVEKLIEELIQQCSGVFQKHKDLACLEFSIDNMSVD